MDIVCSEKPRRPGRTLDAVRLHSVWSALMGLYEEMALNCTGLETMPSLQINPSKIFDWKTWQLSNCLLVLLEFGFDLWIWSLLFCERCLLPCLCPFLLPLTWLPVLLWIVWSVFVLNSLGLSWSSSPWCFAPASHQPHCLYIILSLLVFLVTRSSCSVLAYAVKQI